MDEISPLGITDVWEVRDGRVTTWELDPRAHGHAVADVSSLRGGAPHENAARVARLLEGDSDDGAGRAAVVLNAGAALYVAGVVASFEDGTRRAATSLAQGAGLRALERLRQASPSTSE